MRTLLFGATLVTAFLLPVTPAAAQCCGGAAQAMDHSAHAAPATPAAGCCAGHEMAAPAPAAKPMACCDHPVAATTPMPCCDRNAAAVPADDPAVAMAGLGLSGPRFVTVIEGEFRGGGKTAPAAVPIR